MSERRIEVAGMGRWGDGTAVADGVAIFIPFALPGEIVRAQDDAGNLHLAAIERRALDRIEPVCRYFTLCGGCRLQHWRDEPYRQWKRGLLITALKNRGIEVPVAEIIDAHGDGRRRVSIHVRRRDEQIQAGFMAARSHDLLDIERCPIVVPALKEAMDIARTIGAGIGDCDVALTAADNGIDASVKVERKAPDSAVHDLASRIRGLIRFSVNGEPIATWAAPYVTMGRAKVALPPVSFLQATGAGEVALAERVIAACGKSGTVADLFCGLGPFALRLAEGVSVSAFDNDTSAIAALGRAYRTTPGLKPLAVMVRDLFREPLVPGELNEFDAVIFDPPRAGAEAQARQLAKSAVPTVIAVSCDPASFARDAQILLQGGYVLRSVTPVDQFKYSPHVEAVGVFQRSPLR
jgi:23S rRNA (uracil1939-C5)-methyltransferase